MFSHMIIQLGYKSVPLSAQTVSAFFFHSVVYAVILASTLQKNKMLRWNIMFSEMYINVELFISFS